MTESAATKEFPNIVTLLERALGNSPWAAYIRLWEDMIFSLLIAVVLIGVALFVYRKNKKIPDRLQCSVELFVGGIDDFICGFMGPKGRKFVPFLGTLFIYILGMNLNGLIPFFKSATSNLSVTFALAIIVFVYVQITAFKELGLIGYIDHLMGKPRGFLAFSVVIPLLMLCVHIITELARPITLALRLRSNIWGDDLFMTILAGFGLKSLPLLLFSMILSTITAIAQAVVFCLLATVYFALILNHEDQMRPTLTERSNVSA